MFKKIILLFLLFRSSLLPLYSQATNSLDSLLHLLTSTPADTSRVNILIKIGDEFQTIYIDSALLYWKQANQLALKISFHKGIAKSLYNMGMGEYYKGNYIAAMDLFKQSLKIKRDLTDTLGVAQCYNSIGIVYYTKGDYPNALDFYQRSLKLREKIKDGKGKFNNLLNIGNIYMSQGDFVNSLKFYQMSLQIAEEITDPKGIALSLSNIGNIYFSQKDYSKALDYQMKALSMREKISDKRGIAQSLNNVGIIYENLKEFNQSLNYFQKGYQINYELQDRKRMAECLSNIGSTYKNMENDEKSFENFNEALKIYEDLNEKDGLAATQGSIGGYYLAEGKLDKSEIYFKLSFLNANEIGAQHLIYSSGLGLYQINKNKKNFELSLFYFEKAKSASDTMFNDAKSKEIGKLETRYEIEKKLDEQARLEQETLRITKENKQRRDNIQYSSILVLLLFLFLIVFLTSRLNIKPALLNGIVFFTFLLFFEAILVVIEPYTSQYFGDAPLLRLSVNSALALTLVPLHRLLETKIKKWISA